MAIQELHTYLFTCDGWHPRRAQPCGCTTTITAVDNLSAMKEVKRIGWREEWPRWYCNRDHMEIVRPRKVQCECEDDRDE